MIATISNNINFKTNVLYSDKKIIANRDGNVIIRKLTLSDCVIEDIDTAVFEILSGDSVTVTDDDKDVFNVKVSDIFFLNESGKLNIEVVLKRVDIHVQ